MATAGAASTGRVIDFRGVAVARGGRPVLQDVTLAVEPGEVVALVGRSGSGKTTLLRLVNRLADADRGDVHVDGRDVTAWDAIELRRRVGYAIQDVGLFPHYTVADNVAIVPRLLEWPAARVAARVDELLALVGLEPAAFRDRWPDQLSGGQRQRVGLARALAADPPVLLMDEPFGALDPITRVELHREFRALQAKLPRAVLLVTHDLSEAFALAARIAVLHEGRVVACEPPDRLAQVDDPHVRALLETRFG
jgi:osmoprotectant transport system ATP-binding protein